MSELHKRELIKSYPFVKWAGGKRQLLNDIKTYMPNYFNRYFEPFIGGGAVFFDLQIPQSYISDINEELINLYLVVKNHPKELINNLRTHLISKEYFLDIRAIDRTEEYKSWDSIRKASRFIYLNKTCFNGLYRVNSKGEFNVPYGDYKNPLIVDVENIYNCSLILQDTNIYCADFSIILNHTKKDDFVYLDPPYAPLNATSSFTSYTKEGFDISMQHKLKLVCDNLTINGVKFLLSNSNTPLIQNLYRDYNILEVFATRSINSKANGRGVISEVLVKNY